jgi:NTP pyrophosphatase (non-canonical NTP hydrolase)
VVALIAAALEQAAPAGAPEAQLRVLQQGRVAAFQQFHREREATNGAAVDPLIHYLLLVEEVGELATALRRIAADSRTPATIDEAIAANRPALREEMADLLAHLLKLANDTGIDLEQAYLDKMRLQLAAAPHGNGPHVN